MHVICIKENKVLSECKTEGVRKISKLHDWGVVKACIVEIKLFVHLLLPCLGGLEGETV